jgi:hypothetical protein
MTITTPATDTETRSAPGQARRIFFSLLCAAALAAGGAACSGGDDGAGAGDPGDSGQGGDEDTGGIADAGDGGGGGGGGGGVDAGGGGGGGGGEADCPLGPPQDPAGLAECCPDFAGTAHCLPSDQLDPAATEQLAACDDGASTCVPDVWIEGNVDLVECSSVAGPGVCLSQCIPLVADNAQLLQQDICADSELCVPCDIPGQGPSGACELDLTCNAPGDPPGGDPPDDPPPSAEQCCDSRGVCIAESAVPPDRVDNLQQDTCSDDSQLCVPTDLIDPAFEAQPCESTIGGLGGSPEGACLHDCLAMTGLFLEDGCGDGFKCVPCELPILGETGACDFLPGGPGL